MMDKLVEDVARAISDVGCEFCEDGYRPDMVCAACEAKARAAILATLRGVREPTEGMIEAGAWKLCSNRACECDEEAIFQAMIDAALQEDKP